MQTERGGALTRLGQLKEGKQLLEALLPSGGGRRPRQHTNILVRLAVVDHYQGRLRKSSASLTRRVRRRNAAMTPSSSGFSRFAGEMRLSR